ncbi:Hypothetical protein POVR1_LOCUS116 [uncultured virus]|nr:Hypothetical protein POVR1_LOCUS116 [uncultured virus]
MDSFYYVKYLTDYAGYNFSDHVINQLVDVYDSRLSVGDLMEKADLPLNRYVSNLANLREEEAIFLDENTSYQMYIEIVMKFPDLQALRALNVSENSINLTNQALEYLLSGQNLEELKISEERHCITSLPFPYLSKLKILFICNDRNITINDEDLKFLPNLLTLALSWNNTITNNGLRHLKRLIGAALYGNDKVDFEGLRVSNPQLRFVISSMVEYDDVPANLTRCFHSTTKY